MTPFEDKMVTFLIHPRQLAQSYRDYFYSIWDKYKNFQGPTEICLFQKN